MLHTIFYFITIVIGNTDKLVALPTCVDFRERRIPEYLETKCYNPFLNILKSKFLITIGSEFHDTAPLYSRPIF